MTNKSLRNKNTHWESMQLFACIILIEKTRHQSFQVFSCESVADEDEETVPDMLISNLLCVF